MNTPPPGPPPSYGYDPRRGAAGYAPIIGSTSGFVVTAVVVVFTVQPSGRHPNPNQLALSTGLLVLGLIACLLSAFIFAAIAAERELTVNLPPASLLAGSAAGIGITAILGAFEVLAAMYLPDAKELFAIITVGTQFGAVILVASVLGDTWLAYELTHHYNPTPQWLTSSADAKSAALTACSSASAPLALGAALYFAGIDITLGKSGTYVFIGAGIALTLIMALGGLFRTMHAPDGLNVGLRRWEAISVLGALTLYLTALTICLP